MTILPPHLPPESCSIHLRTTYVSIRNLILFVGLALIAGIAGALAVSAWIEPTLYDAAQPYVSRNTISLLSEETPDAFVLQRYKESTISLYKKQARVGREWLSDDAFVTRVVMLTSDGWGVVYSDALKGMTATQLLALDPYDASYTIRRIINDDIYGMTYIQFEGNNFHVLPFFSWHDMQKGMSVWTVDDTHWKKHILSDVTPVAQAPYPIYAEYERFSISPTRDTISIALSTQGHLLGFVDANNYLHTAWSIAHHMASLLEDNTLASPTLDVSGYMVSYRSDVAHNSFNQGDKGFFVSAIHGSFGNIRVGDIIIAVNGKSIDPSTLYQDVLDTTNDITLTIWRDDEKFDILLDNE